MFMMTKRSTPAAKTLINEKAEKKFPCDLNTRRAVIINPIELDAARERATPANPRGGVSSICNTIFSSTIKILMYMEVAGLPEALITVESINKMENIHVPTVSIDSGTAAIAYSLVYTRDSNDPDVVITNTTRGTIKIREYRIDSLIYEMILAFLSTDPDIAGKMAVLTATIAK